MDTITAQTSLQLLAQLQRIERAITRARLYERYHDRRGRLRVRISADLMRLAEQEANIAAELRSRHGRAAVL